MRTHPKQPTRVERANLRETNRINGVISKANLRATMPTFWRGQIEGEKPREFLAHEVCRDLVQRGWGEFINRGRAFRRHDKDVYASLRPGDENEKSDRGLQSLKPNETLMDAFVDGVPKARLAIEGWA